MYTRLHSIKLNLNYKKKHLKKIYLKKMSNTFE